MADPAVPGPEERNWATFCHLAALAVFTQVPFANILGPLILWLIKKDQSPFVNHQGKEALNFQITVAIALLAALALSLLVAIATDGDVFPFLLIPLAVAITVANVVLLIIAAVRANKGQWYRYPVAIRFLK